MQQTHTHTYILNNINKKNKTKLNKTKKTKLN